MVCSQVAVADTLLRCPLDEIPATIGAGGAAPLTCRTSQNESNLESGQNPSSAAVLHKHCNQRICLIEQCSSK